MTTLKLNYTRTLTIARPASLALLALGLALQPSKVAAMTTATNPAPVQRAIVATPALDTQRLFALGMIETGNDDRAIGRAGEISRYQLSPSVWKNYSSSHEYRNTDLAVQVARMHWNYLAAYFQEKTGRPPTDFDMYVLWNTRYGYYANHGFSKRQLADVVRERAQRFVNLVQRRG